MRVQQRENLTTESINKSTCSHVIKAFNSHACGSSKRETRQGCAEVGIALPFHMLSLWSTFCFWLYYAILVLEKITVNDIRMGSIRRRFTFFMRRCSWKSSSWSLWRLLIGWKWHCKMRERDIWMLLGGGDCETCCEDLVKCQMSIFLLYALKIVAIFFWDNKKYILE